MISKYIFLTGLFFVLLSAIAMISNHLGFALRFLVISFWIMAVGTLFYILELKNEK